MWQLAKGTHRQMLTIMLENCEKLAEKPNLHSIAEEELQTVLFEAELIINNKP